MSNHGYQPNDQSHESKPETSKLPSQSVSFVKQPSVSQSSSEFVKTSIQALTVTKSNRTIAPAPTQKVALPQPVQTANNIIISGGTGKRPTLVSKITKTGPMGNQEGKLNAQPNPSSKVHPMISARPTGAPAPAQITAQPVAQVQRLPASSGQSSITGTPPNTVTVTSSGGPTSNIPQMASLIRGVQVPPQTTSHIQVKAKPPVGTGVSHVPRGASAASALSAPKTGAVATPIQRGSTIQLPPSTLHSTIMPGGIHPLQPRVPLLTAVRPGTPPANRATSPAASTGHPLTGEGLQRPNTTTTVQITLPRNTKAIHPTVAHQKVVLSQASVAPLVQGATVVTTTAKTVSVHSTSHNVPSTTTNTTTSIPIAKVQPQRQESRNDNMSGGNVYIGQTHRGSPNAINISNSGSMTETRTERPSLPHVPYNLSTAAAEYYMSNPYTSPFMYYPQPAATQHGQSFTPISTTSAIRPGLYPSQTPNLAATLQAAAHSVPGTTTTGLRLNPGSMMLTAVDPSRHTTNVHTQQYGGSAPTETLTVTTDTAVITTGVTHIQRNSSTPQPSPQQNTNPSASPRPSILRKRTNDGTILVRKNLMSSTPTGSDAGSPQPGNISRSATNSPKLLPSDLATRENSQSSTDTAPSTEQNSPSNDLRIKQEPSDGPVENGSSAVPLSLSSQLQNNIEASPRKKPRKQLLNANEELKDGSSTEEETETKPKPTPFSLKTEQPVVAEEEEKPEIKEEYTDADGIRWVAMRKRNQVTLLNSYHQTWKAKNNHFLRYSDVKLKDERRPTVNELSNQKGVVQKASGWKLYHLATQLEELMDLEKEVGEKICKLQRSLNPKTSITIPNEEDISKIKELTQGSKQRSQLVVDQMDEARSSLLQILEHKPKILEIIQKHHSKRPVKKKERT